MNESLYRVACGAVDGADVAAGVRCCSGPVACVNGVRDGAGAGAACAAAGADISVLSVCWSCSSAVAFTVSVCDCCGAALFF